MARQPSTKPDKRQVREQQHAQPAQLIPPERDDPDALDRLIDALASLLDGS
jgi:hypothetical protein